MASRAYRHWFSCVSSRPHRQKTQKRDISATLYLSFCSRLFPESAAKGSFEKSVVIQHCHQTLPKVLLKWWLSLKTVIKDCPKFCWSDGCLSRLSSKTAQSSAEVMAVLKDCHQRLPKVLLKWWLSLKIVIKDCQKLCWSDGCLSRLEKRPKKRLQILKD